MLRGPLFWVTFVLVPFFVYNLVGQYQLLNPDRTYPDRMAAFGLSNESLRMAAYQAVWAVLVYTMLFVWLNRSRPQKSPTWFLSFGWGVCIAAWTNICINSWTG